MLILFLFKIFPLAHLIKVGCELVPFQLKEDYERKIRELEEQLQLIMNESKRVKLHNNEILQQKLSNDQKINELLRRLEGNLIYLYIIALSYVNLRFRIKCSRTTHQREANRDGGDAKR